MKIGLLGDDSANPPKVSDARAIALQMWGKIWQKWKLN
jgi:hypothetical protein